MITAYEVKVCSKTLKNKRTLSQEIHSDNIHATELKAVGISLVMRGQVIVVEDTDAKHSGVHTSAKEEDCDEARHLEE